MKTLEEMRNVEYPNPYLVRKDFVNLDGIWEFSFDDSETEPNVFSRLINVPFPYESKDSLINDQSVHTSMWYRRKITIRKHEGRVLLHFGAVDYETIVFLNGEKIGFHQGGYTSFVIDISEKVHEGNNRLSLHVFDSLKKDQLRGKQRCKVTSYDCWYVQTSGIVKPVWIEYAGTFPLDNVRFCGDETGKVTFDFEGPRLTRKIEIFEENGNLVDSFAAAETSGIFRLKNPHLWSNDDPHVYYCRISDDSACPDTVETIFACRKVETKEDGVYLNGKKTYLRMVLSQGYWPDSLTTPPSLEALYTDARLTLEMGFNGVRVHQKIEVPNFYYMCDLLGIMSWGEIPSAYEYDDRNEKLKLRTRTSPLIQKRAFSISPSIIAWLFI
jgi:beta-galactosidase/beta-glucuronidase